MSKQRVYSPDHLQRCHACRYVIADKHMPKAWYQLDMQVVEYWAHFENACAALGVDPDSL